MLVRPKLSKRMKTFIEHGLPGEPFWDVCCDHGYIGIGAMRKGSFSEVHFVDQIPHIMERLDQLILESPYLDLKHKYTLHCLPGEEIKDQVEGTLLIAGVGGTTIRNILEALNSKKLLSANRILLSPHMDEHILRAYLETERFLSCYQMNEKILILEGKRQRPLYIFSKLQ